MWAIKLTERKSRLIRVEVSFDEANTFAQQRGIGYIETSAKASLNVEEAFVMVATKILEKIENKSIDPRNEV